MDWWNNESQQEEYFRAQNNRRKFGHHDPVIGLARTALVFAPIIGGLYLVLNYGIALISVGIIGVCIFVCIKIGSKARNPIPKILITIFTSIALIIFVMYAASPNNANRTPS